MASRSIMLRASDYSLDSELGGRAAAMDATFGWAGAGHRVDEYLSRQTAGCGQLDMEEAFLGVCFGKLQCDGDGALIGGGADAGAGALQVSSNAGAIEGGVGMADGIGDPLAFLGVGTKDVLDAGLLEAVLAFTSRELGVGDGEAAVSNSNGGAMLSSYSGTITTGGNMSSGQSNNYGGGGGGGGHDAEVVSPASMSPTTTAPPPPLLTFPNHASSNSHHRHIKRKVVSDEYDPATANAATTTTTALPAPFPRPAAGATSISFRGHVARAAAGGGYDELDLDMEAMAQVKEMVYRAAAMRPVNLGPEAVAAATAKPLRKNVRVSRDPQTVAARLRRGRVSERLRVLRKLVPGGSKMDTAFMLELETLGTSTTNNASTSTGSSSSGSTATRSQQQYNYYGSRGGSNNPSAGFLGFAAGMKEQ